MRYTTPALLVLLMSLSGGCDRDSVAQPAGSAGAAAGPAGTAAEAQVHASPGDPHALPKVPAQAEAISSMLGERFGEATARTIRVEVDKHGGGTRVSLTGEVPNQEIRQAVMNEVEARVEGMKFQDFNLAIAGPVRMLFGFDARIDPDDHALFMPDLSLIITQKGAIYENATGRRLNRMAIPENNQDELKCSAISPDGKTLAGAYRGGGIRLWEMPYGRNPKTLDPPPPPTSYDDTVALAFSPDGKFLASVNREHGDVRVWELARGSAKQLGSHVEPESARTPSDSYVVCFSPDGKTVASANREEGFVLVWDIASRSLKQKLTEQRPNGTALCWTHDGKKLIASRGTEEHRGPVICDLASGKATVLSTDRDELIPMMALSPDDKTLAVSYQNEGVRLWDLQTGTIWQTIDYTKVSAGEAMAFSPDGTVLITTCPGLRPPGVRLWDVSRRPGAAPRAASLPKTFADQITQDDRLAAEIDHAIRRNHDRRNIQALSVEVLADGTIRLRGKVSDTEVKRIAQLEAETHHCSEDSGPMPRNKVVNELQVTGKYE